MKTKEELMEHMISCFAHYGEYIGIKILEIGDECVKLYLDVDDRHLNALGTMHGGATVSILDHAAGMMTFYASGGRAHVTRSCDVHYLAPALKGRVFAEARVMKLGGRTALTEAKLFDADGKLLACGSFEMYAI